MTTPSHRQFTPEDVPKATQTLAACAEIAGIHQRAIEAALAEMQDSINAAFTSYKDDAQRRADNMNRLFAQIEAWNSSGRRKYLRRYYVRGLAIARRRRGKRG